MEFYNDKHYPDPTAFLALANIEKEVSSYKTFVYVCSPYSGDVENNINAARRYSRFVISKGYIPLAPHLLFTQFLDDARPLERELGMQFGRVLMARCSELWVFGKRISDGMKAEIKAARWLHRPIRHFKSINGLREADA